MAEDQEKAIDPDEIRSLAAALKEGGRGADQAIAKLTDKLSDVLADNAKLRARVRDQKAAAVPEGALVLAPDDAKAWKKYREIDADPAALRKRLDDGAAAETRWAQHERTRSYEDAARAHGYRPGLFARLAKADGLTVAVEEGEKDGKPVRAAFVMGEDGKKTPLDDYAKAHWGEDLPALKAEPDTPARPVLPPPHERRGNYPPPARPGQAAGEAEAQLLASGRYHAL